LRASLWRRYSYTTLTFSPPPPICQVRPVSDSIPSGNSDQQSNRNWSRSCLTQAACEIHKLTAWFPLSLCAHAHGNYESIRLSELLNRCRDHPIQSSFSTFSRICHIRFPISHAASSTGFKLAPSPCHFKSMTLQLYTFIDNIQMDFVNNTMYNENFRLQIHSVLNGELEL